MELRHLRYFVAVADAGSLTVAAARKLHTSQPSLSRQIRDLEDEVGAQLLTRTARGIELTPAGRAFLEHARLALSQVEAAAEAAHRVAHPANSRGGPCDHGNVLNSVDAWRGAVTCLRTELSPFVCNESSPEGRYADC